MKISQWFPELLALMLTGVLFYVIYHKPQRHLLLFPAQMHPVSTVATISGWLISTWIHWKRITSISKMYWNRLKSKENEMNAELSGMEKRYQKKITEWQKKAPTMSQTESQQAQQEYAQMQQNYQIRKQPFRNHC